MQWLRDGLGIVAEAAETEGMAASLESNDDVYFVPALTGLGSPHWDPYARGTIVGLTRGTTPRAPRPRGARGDRLPDGRRGPRPGAGRRRASSRELRADGGAVANRWLMQFQADVLGAPVIVPEISETTALGAAYLAGIGAGLCGRASRSREMWREAARYEPRMAEDERERLLGRWREAVERARGWATSEAAEPARNPPRGTGVGAMPARRRHARMADLKPQLYKDEPPAGACSADPRVVAHPRRRLDLRARPR